RPLDDASPQPLVAGCRRALALLAEYADLYQTWVGRVVQYLVPWKPLPDQLPSGSSSHNCAPGVLGIGNHGHPLALVDSLVHEASHHHYYILTKLGPVDDGSDANLYYNPFLEMDRPIGRILLAYHAFANVLLFCRLARARGLPPDPYLT